MTGEENKYTNMEGKENTNKDVEVGLYLHVVEEEEDSKIIKLIRR
jgi:hypothetical protein